MYTAYQLLFACEKYLRGSQKLCCGEYFLQRTCLQMFLVYHYIDNRHRDREN